MESKQKEASVMVQADDGDPDKVDMVARERSGQTQVAFPGDPTGLTDGLVMKVRKPV